jgi:acyl-coenzyme A synthetase/AMP-(fatty) acid ligase
MMAEATFRDRLLRHARDRGDVPALAGPDAAVRYRDLPGVVGALAASLRRRGVEPGDVVALTARREVEHLLAVLALFEVGAGQVALASHDPAPLRARLAARVRATKVVADRRDDAIEGLDFVDLDEALADARAHPGADPMSAADAADAALYLTGSGTTGEPKVVGYAQRDVAAQADVLDTLAGQRFLRPAHVEYNNSKRRRLYALWQGATSVFSDASADPVRSQCVRLGITWLELSPLHAADLAAACRADGRLPDGVSIRIGGGPAPYALRRAIIEAATPRLYVSYGATEAAIVSIADPTMHDEREALGPPAPGVEIAIERGDGARAGPDEIGEIRVRAPGMATGYVGDAAATARHFRDGWFLPGDMASRTREGWLCVHGRVDDMMILNSINIFPAEIERVLERHASVRAAAAFPIASPTHGQIPAAAVELREGSRCTSAELLAYARSQLGVRAPRRIEILAALPRNPQGKVLKREIARVLEAGRA